ncbi:putative P450 monooxygenase [Aureobasidium subglaciale]|nr:putative P450 monooxygenase [Aureobasidium subglaciale]
MIILNTVLSPAQLLIVVGGLIIFYHLLNLIVTAIQNRNYARSQHCGQIPVRSTSMLGLSTILKVVKISQGGKLLEANASCFKKMQAKTFAMMNNGQTMIYTIDPENLKAMLATQFDSWELSAFMKTAYTRLLGHGIFTTDGAAWKHSRAMLKPSFTRGDIGNVDMLEHHAVNLIKAIRMRQHQDSIDLGDLFFRMTTDFATEYLFGEATESLERGPDHGFCEAFTGGLGYIGKLSRTGRLGLLSGFTKFRHERKYLYDFIDRYVKKALENVHDQEKPEQRHTFLHELSQQTTDVVRIRTELLNIMIAGRDTTASLLTNTWHVLSHRPDIIARLREELSTNLDLEQRRPTFEDLKSLPYLSAVFKESLRIHPVTPLNTREAVISTTLPRGGGPDGLQPVFVAKGQAVIYSLYAMQRDVDVFGEDADEFRPERWLDMDGEKGLRPGYSYIPFNAGPRVCLGQQLALTEASYVTVRLLEEFRSVEARDDRPWTEAIGVTCVNKYGALVALA